MRKALAMFAALAMVSALMPQVIVAQTPSIPTISTAVTIAVGGGNVPVVKAKWEQDTTISLEDADPSHITPGAQFDPPCVFQGKKPVEYYAIVTDAEDGGDLKQVWADVYHPDGSFKYEIPYAKINNTALAKAKLQAAVAAGLVTFNPPYTLAEILTELDKGTARLWMGTADLDYEQPAGDYTVNVTALDFNDNPSLILTNKFLYVPVSCFAVDNTAVNYGSVSISKPKVVAGDTIFLLGDGKMTVRNLGNTNMQVVVRQDDMGFGKDITGMWNVEFDGRVGHLVTSVVYNPFVDTVLPGVLPHSTDDELDFSIHVKKGLGSHNGTMVLSSVVVP